METRFKKNAQILVDAFKNERIQPGSCPACAVGNLLAYNNNIEIEDYSWLAEKEESKISLYWYNVISLNSCYNEATRKEVNRFADNTGYTEYQLKAIEKKFEEQFRFYVNKESYGDRDANIILENEPKKARFLIKNNIIWKTALKNALADVIKLLALFEREKIGIAAMENLVLSKKEEINEQAYIDEMDEILFSSIKQTIKK